MSHTIKTLSDGDILRKALASFHNKAVFLKTINRQYDNRFAVTGAKNGGSLLIREPNQFTVRTGAVMDTQDITESTQTLTMATQKGVDLNFSSIEHTLSLDDFQERVIDPAMSKLAAMVQKDIIDNTYYHVYNFENTTFGTKPTLADVLACRAKLQQGLAPMDNRSAMVDALAANAIITDGKSLFHAASEIESQYSEGKLGRLAGIDFYESEMTPVHTNGTRTTAGTCDLSAVDNGDTTIALVATTGEIFEPGDILTLAGVYAVNPETKTVYPHLQQFTVTAQATAADSAIAALAIEPTLYKSGAKQNVYCADWTASTAATVVDLAGSSGTASTAYTNSLIYHKDAFTAVFADLYIPQGEKGFAREVFDGISMRLWRDKDITNDKFPMRIDVLYGYKCIRPEWAVRMCS